MELLMCLLLAGRILASLMPYVVGVAVGLAVLWIVPPAAPTYIKLLAMVAVTVGLIASVNGQLRGK